MHLKQGRNLHGLVQLYLATISSDKLMCTARTKIRKFLKHVRNEN